MSSTLNLAAEPSIAASSGRPQSPRAAWLVAYAACVLAVLARVPTVATSIRTMVDEAIAAGTLTDTSQRPLAVSVGVTLAVALTCTALAVVVVVLRRLEGRLRLPTVTIGSVRRVPGALVVLVVVWMAKQLAGAIRQPTSPLTDPVMWLAAAAGCALAVLLVSRAAPTAARRRVLVTALSLGVVLAAI